MSKNSRGVELLADLLKAGGPEAVAVKAAVHRSQLNNYRACRRGPSVETAFLIERASAGKVPASAWSEPPKGKATKRAKAAPAPEAPPQEGAA